MILDTSFLIDLQNSVDAAATKARAIERTSQPRRVPHVVLYQLYIGVGKGAQSEANRERIDRVLSSLPLEPTTAAIARRAGELEGELQRGDEGVGSVDAIVGATALEYDEPVVTADVDHFERMPGVEVEPY